jgi:hypothetical protein
VIAEQPDEVGARKLRALIGVEDRRADVTPNSVPGIMSVRWLGEVKV